MEKAYRILTKIFYIVLLICPFGLALGLALFNLTIGWDRLGIDGRDNLFYSMDGFTHPFIGAVVCLAIFTILAGFYVGVKKITKREWIYCLYAFFVTVLLRGLICMLYRDSIQPFSDFACAWENAKGNLYLLGHYQFFPAYLNYAVFERIITHFDRQYYYVVFASAILNGFTAVGICTLGKETLDSWKYGFVGALLYAFMPSGILYAQIGNPEHITVTCNVWGLYLTILVIKRVLAEKGRLGKSILMTVLAGGLFGFADSMKSFFAVIAVALLISFVLLLFKDKNKNFKKAITCILLYTLLALVAIGTKKCVLKFTEHVFQIEEHSEDSFPHFLMVGLTREGEGQIGKTELSRTYTTLKENGYDSEEAKQIAFTALKDDWKGHEREIPLFALKKIIWEWQGDSTPYWYFKHCMEIIPNNILSAWIFDFINEYGPSIGEAYYLLIMAMGAVGTFFEIKRNDRRLSLVLTNLCVFGFFCLMLIFEAQSRYKCLIWPFICIIAVNIFKNIMREKISEE